MKKFIAGLLAGVSVLALTLVTLLLDSTTFLLRSWKVFSVSIAIFAIVCMISQGVWTKQEEDEERKERERLYRLVHKILDKLEKREKKRGRGTQTVAGYAALYADGLLKSLRQTDATKNELDPGSHYQLFEQLKTASSIGQMSFNEGGYLEPVPRKRVLDEIERLALLAVTEFDESKDSGVND